MERLLVEKVDLIVILLDKHTFLDGDPDKGTWFLAQELIKLDYDIIEDDGSGASAGFEID